MAADTRALLALKERLPRAWPAFFERHGSFTPAQLAAMPPLLDGENVLLVAPTASGKTEAVVAPLVERHLPPRPARSGLGLLYVAPTRALVNGLLARLTGPLHTLDIAVAVRTRDVNTLRPGRVADLLITTPESLDALLAAQARLFAGLRAVILDELHALEGTPRGDGLRVLLNRLRHLRAYAYRHGDAPDASMQYAALSATLPRPAAVAARYFPAARVVEVGGGRPLEVESIEASGDGVAELLSYLDTFRARGWRKALAFCNSRGDVEAYAAAVRGRTPFAGAVYVHYSNIAAKRRLETERRFATAGTALLFATSTLELGIDVGDVDDVLLIGPPGRTDAFHQRIGRGNRRRRVVRAACLARTPLERLMFAALRAPQAGAAGSPPPFRPAVAVQQVFSLIKASPTGAVRLAELAPLFDGLLPPAALELLCDHLAERRYLTETRPGDWTAGPHLNALFDRRPHQGGPSIHSNIQSDVGRRVTIRDQHTHEVMAEVDAQWLNRTTLTLEGRPVTVEWDDGEALWVSATPDEQAEEAEQLVFRSTRQVLSYELACLLPVQLGLSPQVAPFVRGPDGWWWFHWLGDLYGWVLYDLLRTRLPVRETRQPGLCLYLPEPGRPRALPSWTEDQVRGYLRDTYLRLEPMLTLGPFQGLLPQRLRRQAVVEQFDVPRFVEAVGSLQPVVSPDDLAESLTDLLAEGW